MTVVYVLMDGETLMGCVTDIELAKAWCQLYSDTREFYPFDPVPGDEFFRRQVVEDVGDRVKKYTHEWKELTRRANSLEAILNRFEEIQKRLKPQEDTQ